MRNRFYKLGLLVLLGSSVLATDIAAQEIANDFPNNILLLRMEGHLSSSLFGVIHDIFDCSDKIITDFWIAE